MGGRPLSFLKRRKKEAVRPQRTAGVVKKIRGEAAGLLSKRITPPTLLKRAATPPVHSLCFAEFQNLPAVLECVCVPASAPVAFISLLAAAAHSSASRCACSRVMP